MPGGGGAIDCHSAQFKGGQCTLSTGTATAENQIQPDPGSSYLQKFCFDCKHFLKSINKPLMNCKISFSRVGRWLPRHFRRVPPKGAYWTKQTNSRLNLTARLRPAMLECQGEIRFWM